MKRGIWIVLALLCAAPASAWAQAAAAGAAASPKADKAAAKPSKKGAKAKEAEPSGPSREARALARRTKSIFTFAVEECTRERSTCEPSLADDAERRFLEACGACASAQRCEAVRDAIRAGDRNGSKDPCAP
jgi:hypothetical protein